MPNRIVFTGKQQVALESFNVPAASPDDVMVRSRYSLMSTGTENIVFNRLFDPGTHWQNWVQYPFYPGYCNVGEVESVGANVTNLKRGDLVFSRCGHTSHCVVAAKHAALVPAGIDPKSAAWAGLIKIAAAGARVAEYKLGDSVLVIGAGPIGQMTVRWAAAAGVGRLIVVDMVESRLALARRGGATDVIALPIEKAADAIRAANGGELPRVVVDTTGHPKVFAVALGLAAAFGRVVLLGDTGTPDQQHLTVDVVVRGLTIVGAHDGHEDAQWNAPKIYRLFFQLAQAGRFDMSGLNTHEFLPSQCEEAYKAANTVRGQTMGILFDWTKS